MTTLYVAIALGMLAAVGVFATVISLSPAAPSNADVVEGRLRVYETGAPPSIAEIELQQPFGERVVRPALTRLGRWFEHSMPEKAREQIYMTLQLAGRPGGMTPSYFIAVRYVLTAALCSLGILIGTLAHNQILLAILATVGAVIGLYGPMFWLRQRVSGRRAEILSDLPDVIDVLVVCVEAGLTFEAAIEQVVQKYEHALASEFGRVMQEVRLGRPRLEALNDMGQRTGVEELNNFVQAIIQSEQLGSGMSRILRIQSDEIRNKRLLSAQERGAKASLKMLIPMLGCIFPTLWVILLGPAAIMAFKILRGG
ncbi:MAG: type II secretion system F family protein [Chloroflexi bacterium]|nr:MAG: type II secretion system F family protein [Chloroflexota bacterium]TMF75645.1 MAG: type II secretion system F family protein [Chloroflexota bacterium]TMF77833.1 MAG: type II secretion system F family protein [Chloroflexota bacterium]TMF93624.1 MAG: type II secretion system F family protein [Chloroflexota bacterium]TMG45396.1 MAG: type II secretion system F family protein [Chloroflexota bacterium]